MASVDIFETLRKRVQGSAAHTDYEKRATYWFRDHRTELTQWQTRYGQLKYDDVRHSTFTKKFVPAGGAQIGRFYFFLYQPMTRELPYYDRFPFVLVLSRESTTSFLGLNFHYLPYDLRAKLFDAMYEDYSTVSTTRPLSSKLMIDYDTLNSFAKYKAFRPCVHRYRVSQLMSPLMQVGSTDWDLALFLPVESFKNASGASVWQKSRTIVNRQRK
jgi:hypothetical protein